MVSIRKTLILAGLIGATGFVGLRAVQAQSDLPPLFDLPPLSNSASQFVSLLTIVDPGNVTVQTDPPPPPLVPVRPPVSQPTPPLAPLS
jgi:hypothetical protein